MKRFSSILSNRKGSVTDADAGASSSYSSSNDSSPEAAATKAIKAFCESNTTSTSGDEVTHLPIIVDNAVSSPAAAAACATQLRKFLSMKNQAVAFKTDKKNAAHIQYNAVMLLRILVDNPGQSFTKYIDTKFIEVVKNVLRVSLDPAVQQILRETLDTFEIHKAPQDNNLLKLVAMWRKEKAHLVGQFAQMQTAQSIALSRPTAGGRFHQPRSNKLPPPEELSSRVEEARTSAKLLIQFVQSTPASEIGDNELIKEFADRCQAAQRSMQGFMNATVPQAPDPDTLQTLIETCEQLNVASSKYQRAVLAVRRTQSGTSAASPAVSPPPQGTLQQPLVPTRVSQQPLNPSRAPQQQSDSAANPFGDENQIPEPERQGFPVYRQDPSTAPNSNYSQAAASLGATAAQQQAALDAARARAREHANQTSFSAPAGPPPSQVQQQPDQKGQAESSTRAVAHDDDDDDLYGPPSAHPNGAGANGFTTTNTTATANASHNADSLSAFNTLRIKDDTPLPDHDRLGNGAADAPRLP